MPFDPIDFRHEPPSGSRPGPMAPTGWHGMAITLGLVAILLLLTMMVNITYALEAIGRVADALGW